jgi:uncharacterized protein HemX
VVVAGISSGWVSTYVAIAVAGGGFFGWWNERRRRIKRELADQARKEAREPSEELTAASAAAEAIARASAAMIEPLQNTITTLTGQVGELRAEVREVRTREQACKDELAEQKVAHGRELAEQSLKLKQTKDKLREVTDRLGIAPPPDGDDSDTVAT